MPKSRFSAGVYLALVFLSGALVGSLSYRLYAVKSVNAITNGAPKMTPAEFRRQYIQSLKDRVHLDAQQVDQVNQIMDETRAQFDEVRARSRAEMQAIETQRLEKMNAMLRDDQKPAYAAYRAEREKLRQQQRDKPGKK
jgi:hypothetical protein